jgi:hypothetical protein
MSKANGRAVKSALDEEYVPTLQALAHRLQVSGSSIKNLRRDGLRSCARGYRLSEARKLLGVRALRARNIAVSPDALQLKTEKLELEVERARFELELSKGEWSRKADVTRLWRQAVIVVRDRFKNLGHELAPRLVSLGPQAIRAEIDGRTYEILRLLAHEEFSPIADTPDEPSTD